MKASLLDIVPEIDKNPEYDEALRKCIEILVRRWPQLSWGLSDTTSDEASWSDRS